MNRRSDFMQSFFISHYTTPYLGENGYNYQTNASVLHFSDECGTLSVNPLTVGAAYIRVFILHIKYDILNMLKIKCDKIWK